jgi:hypothetical protein
MKEFKPYTYYLYHVPTGKKYYGCQYGKKSNPKNLWNTYFSSSEKVKALINEYGKESFNAQVRKVFDSGEAALEYEDRFLHKAKAPEKDDWLNQAYIDGKCFSGMSNKTHKQSTKDKIRKAHLGKKLTKEQCKHMSEVRLNVARSKSSVEKQRATMTGKPRGPYKPYVGIHGNLGAVRSLESRDKQSKTSRSKHRKSWNSGLTYKRGPNKTKIKRAWFSNCQFKFSTLLIIGEPVPNGYMAGRLFDKNGDKFQ